MILPGHRWCRQLHSFDGSSSAVLSLLLSILQPRPSYVLRFTVKIFLMGSSLGPRIMSYSRTIAACQQVPLSRTGRFPYAPERRPRDEAAARASFHIPPSPGGIPDVPDVIPRPPWQRTSTCVQGSIRDGEGLERAYHCEHAGMRAAVPCEDLISMRRSHSLIRRCGQCGWVENPLAH